MTSTDPPILGTMVDLVGHPQPANESAKRVRATSKQPPVKRPERKEEKDGEKCDEAENGGDEKKEENLPDDKDEKKDEKPTGEPLQVGDTDMEAEEACDSGDMKKERKGKIEAEETCESGDMKKERKRKKKDLKDEERPKGKTAKAKMRSRCESKEAPKKDDDSEEGGYDDEDEGAAGGEEGCPAGDGEAKTKKDKKGAKAKAKARGRGKKKGDKSDDEGLRDQSKSKKFTSLWDQLPQSVRGHFNRLSRSDQTEFIHSSVTRERGRLKVSQDTMMRLMTQREESQAGREKMKGYALEDSIRSTQIPPHTSLYEGRGMSFKTSHKQRGMGLDLKKQSLQHCMKGGA